MEKRNTDGQNSSRLLDPQIPASYNVGEESNNVENLNEEHQKLVLNESLVIYTKLEIEKLENDTEELNKKCRKLELENATVDENLKELNASIDINRLAIKTKRDTVSILKENINKLQTEAKEQETTEQKVYNEYLNKYKEAKKLFEDHNPLFNHLKKLQNESLKSEVEKKMLSVKIAETKKQMKLREEIQKKIFHTTIVNFAKEVLNNWSSRDLFCKINEEMKKREKLLKEMCELKIAAAKKEDELNRKHHLSSEMQLLTERNWSINDFNNKISSIAAPTSLATSFSSIYDSNILLRDKQLQSEKHLEQIRARFDQRQQQWNQQISTLPQKRKLSSTNLESYYLNTRPSNIKIPRNPTNTISNSNLKFIGANTNLITKKSDFPNKQSQQLKNTNSRVNIISMYSLVNAPETKREVQYTQNINNQTLHVSQQTSQKNTNITHVNQSCQDSQDMSNAQRIPQSQELNKSPINLTPNVRDSTGLHFQNNSNFGKVSSQSQDFKKNLPLAQSQSRYLHYLQNDLPLSQHVTSQKTTQEESQSISTLEKPGMKAVKRSFPNENVQISNQPGSTKADEGVNLLKMLDNKPLELAAVLQKATNLPDSAVTSPFFNNTNKPIDVPDVPNTQAGSELFVNSQMGMNSYFDNLPFSYTSNVDLENNMKLDNEFSPVYFSPTSNPENPSSTNDEVQSPPFNFNFGQVEAMQPNNAPFFSRNTISNPFNMF
ncbi:hypothetical protein ILUMI_01881 [Ignelater luminosus]|uniref:Uncharacterized protein n=1 Tax=Ignelater luminosus TaxID=2038154 RepID=A0A8K0DHL2_IGNLU|nr:hypothetical protein ILUMI_01881 [Ignelater luminosus]